MQCSCSVVPDLIFYSESEEPWTRNQVEWESNTAKGGILTHLFSHCILYPLLCLFVLKNCSNVAATIRWLLSWRLGTDIWAENEEKKRNENKEIAGFCVLLFFFSLVLFITSASIYFPYKNPPHVCTC